MCVFALDKGIFFCVCGEEAWSSIMFQNHTSHRSSRSHISDLHEHPSIICNFSLILLACCPSLSPFISFWFIYWFLLNHLTLFFPISAACPLCLLSICLTLWLLFYYLLPYSLPIIYPRPPSLCFNHLSLSHCLSVHLLTQLSSFCLETLPSFILLRSY